MKWNVGPEHDSAVIDRLSAALRAVGFDLTDDWHGVAGSQEVNHWVVSSPLGELTVETETYVGISVDGSETLVAAVKRKFDNLAS